MLSGFTLVRNAVTLDYPIVPAIRSLLELCDEVVVNVGRSEDGTRDLVAAVADPRVRILDSEWDMSRAAATLALETDRAMRACRGAWGVYIQADEVLHEAGATRIADRVREWNDEPQVEGLLVDYVHLYGDFDTVATNRHWYRREVRVVRLGRDIRSYGDAQGFRMGPKHARVRARATGARMFHYGWARPRPAAPGLEWTPGLRPLSGAHPRVAREWIAARRATGGGAVAPRRLRPSDLRYYASDWIERLTGARVFEYRNYVLV